MLRSTDHIIISHVGAMPRPRGLPGFAPIPKDVEPVTPEAATDEIVAKQLAHGIDVVNDGEFGKPGFLHYIVQRLTGFKRRDLREGEEHPTTAIARRDIAAFPQYFKDRGGVFPFKIPVVECVGDIKFVGQEAIAADIKNLKAAMAKHGAKAGFLSAISPQTVEQVMPNLHYKSGDAYLEALADALHDEYKAITDAGLILQIDDPSLAHSWQGDTSWTMAQTRAHCDSRVEVLNHALRDCPIDQVRIHFCWGSYIGPHATDLELRDFIDIIYKANAMCYSIEGANVRHEHEWTVFKDHPLPDGKIIMPGVVAHATDLVEHPELVAQRLERWGNAVGRENIVAGTDCGMMRVHPELCWAKFDSIAAGAKIASERLWRN